MEGWLVLIVFNKQEPKVQEWLRDKHVEVYYPVMRELKKVRGKKNMDEVTRPLFPGYAFARQGAMNHIGSCPYPYQLLQFGEEFARVSEPQIEAIKSRHDSDGFIRLPHMDVTPRQFKRNQRLKVTSGPFTGLEVLCSEMKGTERVDVLLSLFGTKRKMMLAADSLTEA